MKLSNLLIFVLMAVGAVGIQAQEAQAGEDTQAVLGNGSRLGVRVRLGGTMPITNHDSGSGIYGDHLYDGGFSSEIGAVYNIPLGKRGWYFEPGLMFAYDTWGLNDDVVSVSGIPAGADYDMSFRRFGINIPVQVGFRIKLGKCGLSIYTGPEAGIGLVCKSHESIKSDGVKLSASQSMYGNEGIYNRFGLGWKLGVGLDVNHWYFALESKFDILNMSPDLATTYHYISTRIFTGGIVAGYTF